MSLKPSPKFVESYLSDNMYDGPIQFYDMDSMHVHIKHFFDVFTSKIPTFKNYFAVKALPNLNILKYFNDHFPKMEFDCSSVSELKLVKMIGAEKKTIYTSNFQTKEDLEFALELDVIINIDDPYYLDLIKEICDKQERDLPEIIYLRVNPSLGKTDSKTKSNVLAGKDSKFGIDEEYVIPTILKAKEYGITNIGIHMMTGSCILNDSYFEELVDKFVDIKKTCNENGINVEHVNLGGGIGVAYMPEDSSPDIEKIAYHISKLNDIFTGSISMENGRYITGPFGYLLSRITCVKKRFNGEIFYGVDACMSNLMRPGMYESYHHITMLNSKGMNKDEDIQEAHVVGGLCENNDWFAKNRDLPKSDVGDYVLIHDTGAHSHSMGFQYNGKLRAPEIIKLNDRFIKIRRKETFSDYISTIVL